MTQGSGDSPRKEALACYCNNVTQQCVKQSILDGRSHNLTEIYEHTTAGVGPCGGSCKSTLIQLLRENLKTEAEPNKKESQEAIPPELIEAVSLFNRRFYWEAHEVLEDLWMVERGKARLFYQGIIQAAAAYYHVLNANPKGVIRLAEEAEKKLQAYRPKYLGVDIEPLIVALSKIRLEAREILGNTRTGFDYDALPKLNMWAG